MGRQLGGNGLFDPERADAEEVPHVLAEYAYKVLTRNVTKEKGYAFYA